MRKKRVRVEIKKERIGYSATGKVGNRLFATEADSFESLKTQILEALNLATEDLGKRYFLADLRFEYDIQSFFDFYKVINAKALSERIGMSQSLLAQYIRGIKKPSAMQTKRILEGVHQIGRELTEVKFLLM